jgi:hypothetical protein
MRNAAISWHFERDPIPYALDTDWLVGAAGFELPHFRMPFEPRFDLREVQPREPA